MTRPAAQAQGLCAQLTALGARVTAFPTLEIVAIEDDTVLKQQIQQLHSVDYAIFISANAVKFSVDYLHQYWPELPGQLYCLAIGPATADCMQQHGIPVSQQPQSPYSSEGLLNLSLLHNIAHKHCMIFCGLGGRKVLQETLLQRGAIVTEAVSYQRICPSTDVRVLQQIWQKDKIDIVLATSGESLKNLQKLLGEANKHLLVQSTLLVVSQRMLKLARELGYGQPIIVAENATDEAIISALCKGIE